MRSPIYRFGFLLGVAGCSWGSLISLEDFETYPSAAPLAGLNGGTGWSGGWTTAGTGSYQVIDGGLSYSAGEISVGGGSKALSLSFPNANVEVIANRPLPTQTGTLYMSLLYRNTIDNTPAVSPDFFQAGFLPTSENPAMSVLDRDGTFQARAGTAPPGSQDTGISSDVGVTYFLVLKMENTTGGAAYDTAHIFVNPTFLSEGLNSSTSSTLNDALDLSGSAVFNIRRAFQEAGDTYHVDALRIGTSFGDVVSAIPEPNTWVLVLLGMLLLARRTIARA